MCYKACIEIATSATSRPLISVVVKNWSFLFCFLFYFIFYLFVCFLVVGGLLLLFFLSFFLSFFLLVLLLLLFLCGVGRGVEVGKCVCVWGGGGLYEASTEVPISSEPVLPSGKALGW